MTKKTNVTLLFRKRSPHFNSIEVIFDNLLNTITDKADVDVIHLNNFSNGLINKLKNVWQVRCIRSGLLHITGEIYYTALFYSGKLIVTVHDIGGIKQSYGWRKWIIRSIWFQRIANKADAVVLISEHAKKEYLSVINIEPTKVHVIHNPVPLGIKRSEKVFNMKLPVLLQIGTKSNKNVERLIDAIEGLSCQLLIIGKLTTLQQEKLKERKIKYCNHVGVTNEELYAFYDKADIVTFVSTYEGFGMPIIEAQACGKVVITSNVSSMPEVAGCGALLVNPYSISAIRKGILKLISDEQYRKKLISAGTENIERFTIHRFTDQYAQLYQNTIKNGSD